MKNYKMLVLLLLLSGTVMAQVKNDTIYHLFEGKKYIDHSKSKDSIMKRNRLNPNKTYYLEKFYGEEYKKETMRCKLKARYEANTEGIKQIV